MASTENLLTEIRSNYDYAQSEWKSVRDEAKLDMACVAGNPWPKGERAWRESINRLCLTFDEIQQYANRAINDIRQNKRAVKVTPAGNGATDETAEVRAGLIRNIEYVSKAQHAQITAYESMIQRSYGYFGLTTRYARPDDDVKRLAFRRFPNPDVVLPDPDYKEADASDMGFCFVLDSMRESKFSARWPKAEIKSFGPEQMEAAPAWIKDGSVQVAEYWKLINNRRTLLKFENGEKAFLDELPEAKLIAAGEFLVLPDGSQVRVKQIPRHDKKVIQYISNGLEILETNDWPDCEIPIFPIDGKEMYVDEGAGSKRMLISLVRFARQPFLAYCFARTAEVEIAGQMPKNLYRGYEGQFDTSTDFENINRNQTTYAEFKAKTAATGDAILPLPIRESFGLDIAGLEALAESCRRAIQSAMGITGMLNGASDRVSARSGVALKELDAQSDTGNFHFKDNYDRAIERCGRAMDRLLSKVYDTPQEMGFMKPDETHAVIKVNQVGQHPISNNPMEFHTSTGDHEVTIGVGPSQASQHEAAEDFATEIVKMPNAPPKAIAIAIKLRNLGPLGDQLAECFDPEEGQQQIPPQVQQQMAQSGQIIEQLTQTLHQLQNQLDSKQDELESRERIATRAEETKLTLGLAQIDSKEGIVRLTEELANIRADMDRMHQKEMAQQQHESGLEAAEHQAALQPEPQPPAGPQV